MGFRTQFAHGDFYDVIGNVWQWCESAIYGYDGFEPHWAYDDFSLPTFDGRHNIIKGGSFISIGNELLVSSRYAFRRHFFQHAGFRYVVSKNSTKDSGRHCERDKAISEFLQDQYSEECFVAKVARATIDKSLLQNRSRALDIGCLVGRGSFELARIFDEVVGIDYSARLISCAEEIKNSGSIEYVKTINGKKEIAEIDTNMLGLTSQMRERVKFWQADACNLKPNFIGFDLILAVDLTHRLYAPEAFLSNIHERLNDAGVLVLSIDIAKDSKLSQERVEEILRDNFYKSSICLDAESANCNEPSKVMIWIKK